MLMGYNSDVGYKGITVHVQTEDHGLRGKKITTQVFKGGAILESSTETYEAEIEDLEGKPRDKVIRARMKEMHKQAFRNIKEGKYDERLGISASVSAPTSDAIDVVTPERFEQQAAEEVKAQTKEEPPAEDGETKQRKPRTRHAMASSPTSSTIETDGLAFSIQFACRGVPHSDHDLITAIREALA